MLRDSLIELIRWGTYSLPIGDRDDAEAIKSAIIKNMEHHAYPNQMQLMRELLDELSFNLFRQAIEAVYPDSEVHSELCEQCGSNASLPAHDCSNWPGTQCTCCDECIILCKNILKIKPL